MTYTIKTERIGNHVIEISQDKFETSYKVSLIRMFDENLGRTESRIAYTDIKKAKARYNSLKSKLRKEEERR